MRHESLPEIERASNPDTAQLCSEKSSVAARSNFFRAIARIVWSRKAAFELSVLTGESERTCAYWLSGHREPPASIFMVLLGEVARKLR